MRTTTPHRRGSDKAKAIALGGCFSLLLAAAMPVGAQPSSDYEDLSTWTPVDIAPGDPQQPNSDWILEDDNTKATQRVNTNPAAFLSDQALAGNYLLRMKILAEKDGDNDFIGATFCFRGPQKFMVWDWKQADQYESQIDSGTGKEFGFAKAGMRIVQSALNTKTTKLKPIKKLKLDIQ